METNKNDLKTAIYVRFSTEKQDSEMQKQAISTFLAYKGIQDAQFYEDEGLSGKNTERPAFKTLLDDVKQGKVKRVIVYKLDRLSRSLKDLIETLKLFEAHGTTFISISENIDMSSPAGVLMMQIIGAFGEYERSIIVTRTKDGLKAAKAKGKTLGRPQRIGNELKAQILELSRDGWSQGAISDELHVSISSIRKVQKEEAKRIYEWTQSLVTVQDLEMLKSSTLRKN